VVGLSPGFDISRAWAGDETACADPALVVRRLAAMVAGVAMGIFGTEVAWHAASIGDAS
jgi:hypothetical protein